MEDTTLWWIALGLGLVVLLVAVALLQLLLAEVHRIERLVATIWEAGKQVARNTATTWQLEQTSARLDRLIGEAGEHVRVLKGGGTG